ncbi:1-phosphatidylinositol-4-phosphate 5-kinase [Paragonimus westermani]|uniref:1-phosphatidylinositol-4-phosphate 5-kinase n=1 Tax=Paragonimus westermani TaxID=34504 RepID=A0A5J4NTX0_9TREM|nr:1-phosphatidylinositol-4-phosphate 5-kinase [Paragonimus westermani]
MLYTDPLPATLRNSGPGPPTDSPNKLSVPGSSRTFPRESDSKKGKRIGHRRVTQEGTVTYKKKPTTEIQRALQLGIQHHIGSIQQQRMRDVLYRDFQTIETVQFPAAGSKTTPAHTLSDFRFRTYAPIAFRNFRFKYKLDIRDFLNSLCNHELRELSNPGKSGSIFYITQDDEFIIKTVQHREGEFLRALLPSYFMNLMQHPPTLLPKYHGFYCYQTSRKNIRFVVMNNLLPSSVRIHDKYDLKGSTYRRRASDKELARDSPTLKDLDFRERHPDGIWLEAETYDALIKTIEKDCLVLESLQIMDYSLLLGIHNLDQAKRDRKAAAQTSGLAPVAASGGDECEAPTINANHNGFHPDVASSQRDIVEPLRSSFTSNSSMTTAASSRSHQYRVPLGADGERILPVGSLTDPVNQAQASSPSSNFQRGTSRARSGKRLAAYCTAMESIEASSKPVELEKEELGLIPSGGIPARSSTGDRLLLYMGIIDILQSYRLAKKLEHGLFALAIDGETVSVAPPNFYSQRFQEFLSRTVFKRIQSLDQPTLLGPNAMRFRRFVELAMKKSATKRATVSGRQLSSVQSIDSKSSSSLVTVPICVVLWLTVLY